MKALLRWIVVTVCTVALTTLGLNAFDNRDSPQNSMLGAAFSAVAGPSSKCPTGMVFVGAAGGGFCIDAYENSTGDSCPTQNPASKEESGHNLAISSCKPVSAEKKTPWRNVSRDQAELACARAGKRLPSAPEWYKAALGTPDSSIASDNGCNIGLRGSGSLDKTGARTECVSPAGVYDMIGNAWEWMQETVQDGVYKGKTLPSEGYITGIDGDGTPIATNHDVPDETFFADYFWLDPTDIRGVLRGGYWNSQTDAGQYAINITVPPSFSGEAAGFRCVKDL
jgi:formylglycine-generating enzyme required for sulfatase activity